MTTTPPGMDGSAANTSAPEMSEEAAAAIDRLRGGVTDEKEKRRAKRSFWRELPILIVVALVVAVVIKTFLVQAFYIPSGSMENTLEVGDRVMVNKLAYRFGEPDRGDIVVFDSPFAEEDNGESLPAAVLRNIGEALGFSSPASEFIKRVIAIPGDTVAIRNNQVLVNGETLFEPYLHPGARMRDLEERLIPQGAVWVMGDNRNNSQDSRFFEEIEIDSIVGRAFVTVWPPNRWGGL